METKTTAWQIRADMEQQDAGEGITRQVMGYDEALMLVKVTFRKGAFGTLHAHVHSQASFIVDGSFEVTIGQETKILNAGDGFYVQPNAPHSCLCLEEGSLIDAFSPMRTDFIT